MDEVEASLKKAQNAVVEAEELNKKGLCDGAASRLYFAAFHAARASILKENPNAAPKTHKGVAILYAREVVQKGLAPAEFSALLGRLGAERERADYGGGAASCDTVADKVGDVRRMVKHAKNL